VVFHDIEYGNGHRTEDPALARSADLAAPAGIARMLEIEASRGLAVTYSIVGTIFTELAPAIRKAGHSLAFHSFDHNTDPSPENVRYQVERCRALDSAVVGYRPPQSRLGDGLGNVLLENGFEWLASGVRSLGTQIPVRVGGLVHIPILFDDYPLYRDGMPFAGWRDILIDRIRANAFAAVGLHDCYAPYWINYYHDLLADLERIGRLATFQQMADSL
jgi:peptidoglycan/xylan/chitin deacetylase (PgdA/CDA1 family)